MGVCNTGVLYFDVMALQRFLAVLPTAAAQVSVRCVCCMCCMSPLMSL